MWTSRHARCGNVCMPIAYDCTHAFCVSHLALLPVYPPLRSAVAAWQVPGWVAGEPTTKHRWLPPLESWAKRGLL